MITATVQHHLVQVTSLDPFLHQDGPNKGKMILNMPYWIQLKDGWWFDFIRKDMENGTFRRNLQAGSVYILNKIDEKK